MPLVPPVSVVDDPMVVYLMVGLFAAVALLALWFATPWASRVREPLQQPGTVPPAPPPPPSAPSPWSTTPPDAENPWPTHSPTARRE